MSKTKKILLYALSLIFIVAIAFTAVNSLGTDTYAKVISPYETNLSLSVSYSGVDLILTTTETAGYTYQYWIKKQVSTDMAADSLKKVQSIWQIVGTGFGNYTQTLKDVDSSCLNADGNYEVIVRVKDTKNTVESTDDVIVDELYQICTSASIGQASITSIEVNGKAIKDNYIIVNKSDLFNITVKANLGGLAYELYYGDAATAFKTGIAINNTGVFEKVDISELNAGLHTITVKAAGGNTAIKKFSLYVIDEYIAAARPVITSLKGVPSEVTDGLTTFTMKIKYADGTSIAEGDKNKFIYQLVSGDKIGTVVGEPIVNTDGNLYVTFSVTYGSGKYGIYKTVGTVSRESVNGFDDKIIQYYNSYTRTATLTQTGKVADVEKYTGIAAGTPIAITAAGTITNVLSSNLQYAFYREDASGWVLIKDYPKDGTFGNTLTWTPVRTGIYNIQARIKEVNAGSYEKSITKTYVISGNTLSGTLDVNIYDYGTGNIVTENILTGRPYKLEAEYLGGNEDVLYMFTLTSQNLGTIYLNNYNTSSYYMFIPSRPDNYTIMARVINISNFGYMDKIFPINIASIPGLQLSAPTAYTVEYYFQNIEDNNYTKDTSKTQNLSGTTDTTTNVSAAAVTGFTAQTITQANIDGDGSAVVSVYYNRNSYDLVFKNGDATVSSTSVKYGASISAANGPIAAVGYTFDGWVTENGGSTKYSFGTMPDESVTVWASYAPNTDTAYTVKYYFMNIAGDEYVYDATRDETKYGTTDTTTTETGKAFDGFALRTTNPITQVNIAGDGSGVASVYYDRNTYAVSFDLQGGDGTANGITAIFGSTYGELPSGLTRDNYVFEGWYTAANGGGVEITSSTTVSIIVNQTLYAYWTGEKYSVSAGTMVAAELSDGIVGTNKAQYGTVFTFSFKDTGYYYTVSVTIDGTAYTDFSENNGIYTIAGADIIGAIVISATKYVVNPAVYVQTDALIYDQSFGSSNSIKVYAVLLEDGFYFYADVTQVGITNNATNTNIVYNDAIRFQLGNKDGSALGENVWNFFGVNAKGQIQNLSKAIACVSEISSGIYKIRYEGFISYSALIGLNDTYETADFAGDAYKTATVNVGLALVYHGNMSSQDHILYTPSRSHVRTLEDKNIYLNADNDTLGNGYSVNTDGIKTNLAKAEVIDGVIDSAYTSANYVTYTDTDALSGRRAEYFGYKGSDGLYLAIRVTTTTIKFYAGASSYDIDNLRFAYTDGDGNIKDLEILVDGRLSGAVVTAGNSTAIWQSVVYGLGLRHAVNVDESGATGLTRTNGLWAATTGNFVTTYEIFVPFGFDGAFDESDEAYNIALWFRHRGGDTAFNFANKESYSTTWVLDYNNTHISTTNNRIYLNTVTAGGLYDLYRTISFDNTATGNDGSTIEAKTVLSYGTVGTLESPTPLAGYRFDGWYTADGQQVTSATTVNPLTFFGTAGGITLYARYTDLAHELTINTDANTEYEIVSGSIDRESTIYAEQGTDLVFTADLSTVDAQYIVAISVTIGGTAYTNYGVSGNHYTIYGAAITGQVVIGIFRDAAVSHSVTLSGQLGGLDFSGSANVAYENVNYTFSAQKPDADYYVAFTVTIGGNSVPYTDNGDGTYTIASSYITGNITVTEKPQTILSGSIDFEKHNVTDAVYAASGVSGDFVKAQLNGIVTTALSYSDSAYALTVADIGLGQNILTIETSTGVYFQTFVMATMIIDDLTEFMLVKTLYFKGGAGVTPVAASTNRDGYFILAADINITDGTPGAVFEFTMAPFSNSNNGDLSLISNDAYLRGSWFGMFDGRGYTIYNVTAGSGGMFGLLPSTSVIQNLAIVGATVKLGDLLKWHSTGTDSTTTYGVSDKYLNSGFLCRFVNGTVKNVYIEAEIPAANYFGVISFAASGAHLENIVVRVTGINNISAEFGRYGIISQAEATAGNTTLINCYAFGVVDTLSNLWNSTSVYAMRQNNNFNVGYTIGGYTTLSGLYSAQSAAINAMGEYWAISDDESNITLTFGTDEHNYSYIDTL